MTLTLRMLTQFSGTYTRARGLGTGLYAFADRGGVLSIDQTLVDGVLEGQADVLYASPPEGITLAPSGSVNLDLNGIVTDALADPVALLRVKAVLLYARPENTHNVIVGNGTNPFIGWFGAGTQTVIVPPGGLMVHTFPGVSGNNGWPVVAGTADILKTLNSGAVSDVTYDICVVGASA